MIANTVLTSWQAAEPPHIKLAVTPPHAPPAAAILNGIFFLLGIIGASSWQVIRLCVGEGVILALIG